jgi:hypothetical protein
MLPSEKDKGHTLGGPRVSRSRKTYHCVRSPSRDLVVAADGML